MTPSGKRVCKVCGIEYPYCTTVTKDKYRWQDVACCKEHAMQYFAAVAKARGEVCDDNLTAMPEPVIDGEASAKADGEKPNTTVGTRKKKRSYKESKSNETEAE